MEKEEHKGICEKLFSALSPKPALQSFCSNDHPEENHVSTISAPNPSPPLPSQASKSHLGPQNLSPSLQKPESRHQYINKPEQKKDNNVVPIEIVAALLLPLSPTSSKEKENAAKPPIPSTKEKGQVAQEVEARSPQVSVNEKGRERRSKKKVASAATAESAVPKQDSLNTKEKVEPPPMVPSSEVEDKNKAVSTNIDDKASAYIKRAKLKIRSTSSAGVAAIGRAISFK